MVSGEGSYVAPEDFADVCRATGATIDVVGLDFGTSQRGRGWKLHYDQYGKCVASHATGYTPVRIWWDGFLARPKHGASS